jgi:hypothetical protein
VLETEKRINELDCKSLATYSRRPAWLGTPDCLVVHRTVSGAPGWTPVNRPLSGKFGGIRLKFTGLSGGAPDCPVSQRPPAQRSAAQSAGDAWPTPTVSRGHRTVSGAPTGSALQRSTSPEKEGDRAPDSYSDCPVRHPTEGKDSLPCWPPTGS